MIRKEKLTAIIPVRSGSKGIPNKNLYRLGKYSLLERTIIQAKKCSYIDKIIVSTDSTKMHKIAEDNGVAMQTLRPANLATDDATTIDVIDHALNISKITQGHIILLQVTTPFRTLDDYNTFCSEYDKNIECCSSMISVNEYEGEHPNKIQKIENGYLKSYLNIESMVPRQLLPKVYELNGAFYITSIIEFKKNNSFYSKNVKPFIMPGEKSLNLDTQKDLDLLEYDLSKGNNIFEDY